MELLAPVCREKPELGKWEPLWGMEEWGNASWPVNLSGLEKKDQPLEELKLQLEKLGMRDFQQEHQG